MTEWKHQSKAINLKTNYFQYNFVPIKHFVGSTIAFCFLIKNRSAEVSASRSSVAPAFSANSLASRSLRRANTAGADIKQ